MKSPIFISKNIILHHKLFKALLKALLISFQADLIFLEDSAGFHLVLIDFAHFCEFIFQNLCEYNQIIIKTAYLRRDKLLVDVASKIYQVPSLFLQILYHVLNRLFSRDAQHFLILFCKTQGTFFEMFIHKDRHISLLFLIWRLKSLENKVHQSIIPVPQ